MWFAKFANSLIGSGQDILLPSAHSEYVDYEAELALVIGAPATRTSPPRTRLPTSPGRCRSTTSAPATCNSKTPCGRAGKAIDTFAPCGPALVTLDEIEDLRALGLRTRINGELLQTGTTANLVFSARPKWWRGCHAR